MVLDFGIGEVRGKLRVETGGDDNDGMSGDRRWICRREQFLGKRREEK